MNTNKEIRTIVAFSLNEGKWSKLHESARRVYYPNGIAPNITHLRGGNLEPKIVEYGKEERK